MEDSGRSRRVSVAPARYPAPCRDVGAGYSGGDACNEYLLRHLRVSARIADAFVEAHSVIPESRVIFHRCTFGPGALAVLLRGHSEAYFVACSGVSLSELPPGLTRLGLAMCCVTDEALPRLFAACTSLEFVDLSHNAITDAGLSAVAGAIRREGGRLRLVDLRFQRRTRLTTDPLYAVAPAMPPISETGARDILDAAARSPLLPDVMLDSNGEWAWPEWERLLAEAFPSGPPPFSETEEVWNRAKRVA
jgi:hypothetical protein